MSTIIKKLADENTTYTSSDLDALKYELPTLIKSLNSVEDKSTLTLAKELLNIELLSKLLENLPLDFYEDIFLLLRTLLDLKVLTFEKDFIVSYLEKGITSENLNVSTAVFGIIEDYLTNESHLIKVFPIVLQLSISREGILASSKRVLRKYLDIKDFLKSEAAVSQVAQHLSYAKDSVEKFRIFDIVSEWIGECHEIIEEYSFVIQSIAFELKSSDLLNQICALKSLSLINRSPSGTPYLEHFGVFSVVGEKIQMAPDEYEFSLLGSACLDFIGDCSTSILDEKFGPRLISILFQLLDNNDLGIKEAVLTTIGKICSTREGCHFVWSNRPKFTAEFFPLFKSNMNSIPYLRAVASMFASRSSYVQEVFRYLNFDGNFISEVIALCQSPFVDVELAAFSLLRGIAMNNDLAKKILMSDHFLYDFLLNRKINKKLVEQGKVAKYELVKDLFGSLDSILPKDDIRIRKLAVYLNEGPYYIETEALVSISTT